ncbi:uncharacterized protein LOC135207562 [Macrobrachium nipponense]|uniref:uncharacterized protein LOC135207562 n=1 Tax=Macrobrachium nipponense TaxID=159736 RepID=UPI0030C8B773
MDGQRFLELGIRLLAAFLIGVEGDLLQGVEVPLFAVAGGRVNLSCMYDLRATGLYSLKWYHNDTEFYRYVPTELQQPVDIKRSMKFQANEVSRSDTQVTLTISGMTSAASGEYKCEVIAEHPSFRTETANASMIVLDEPLSSPVITGAKEVYESSDMVHLKCQPEKSPVSGPSPTLTWYLQGRPARREYVSPYREEPYSEPSGIALKISANEMSTYGSSNIVEVVCLLNLGTFEKRATKRIRLRIRHSSYFSTYFSGTGAEKGPSTIHLSLSLVPLLLMIQQQF